MNRVLAAILFLLLPLAILGQVDTNRDADFQQGNRFYEQKDYANALHIFRGLPRLAMWMPRIIWV